MLAFCQGQGVLDNTFTVFCRPNSGALLKKPTGPYFSIKNLQLMGNMLADLRILIKKANATKNCEVCIIKMCFYIKKYGTIIKNIRTIKMRGMGNETDI